MPLPSEPPGIFFNETEVDVFLELSCFVYDPTDISNLVSGPSSFSKLGNFIGNEWEEYSKYLGEGVGISRN